MSYLFLVRLLLLHHGIELQEESGEGGKVAA